MPEGMDVPVNEMNDGWREENVTSVPQQKSKELSISRGHKIQKCKQ